MGKCKIMYGGGQGLKVKNSMQRNVINATDKKIEGNVFLQRTPSADINNVANISYSENYIQSPVYSKSCTAELADHSVLICTQGYGTYVTSSAVHVTIIKNIDNMIFYSNTLDISLVGKGYKPMDRLGSIGCAEDSNGNIMIVMEFRQIGYDSGVSNLVYQQINNNKMNLTAGSFSYNMSFYSFSDLAQNGQEAVQNIKYINGVYTHAFAYTPNQISSSTAQYFSAILLVFRPNASTGFTVEKTTFSEHQTSASACVFINSHVIGPFLISVFCVRGYLTCYVTDLTKITTNIYKSVSDNVATTVSSTYGAFSAALGTNNVFVESLYIDQLYRGIQVLIADDGTPTITKVIPTKKFTEFTFRDGYSHWASKVIDNSKVLVSMYFNKSSSNWFAAALFSLEDNGEIVIKSTKVAPVVNQNNLSSFSGLFSQNSGYYIAPLKSNLCYMNVCIAESGDLMVDVIKDWTSATRPLLACADGIKLLLIDINDIKTFDSENAQEIDAEKTKDYSVENLYIRSKLLWGTYITTQSNTTTVDIFVKPINLNLSTGEFTHYVKPYNDLLYGVSKKAMLPGAVGVAYVPEAIPEATAYGLSYSMVDRVVDEIKREVIKNAN